MLEPDDHQLLREFAEKNSEAAFATLVTRYVNLVYSTALRFSRNPHSAEEITQVVFIILARKAGKLSSSVVLSGWLYQTARLTSANVVKGEIRRQQREQEAYMQSTLNESDVSAWKQIAPLLDDAMGQLGETECNAVVLHFFENKTAREAAAVLRLTEAATHKRLNRALDKLRKFFTKHGVTSTTTIIAGAISAKSVQAAPVALAKTVTAMAIAKGATASASTLTLIKGALKVMAWTKVKTAVVVGSGILLATGTATTIVVHHARAQESDVSDADKAWRFTGVQSDTVARLPPEIKILPTRFSANGNMAQFNDKFVGIRQPVANIIWAAYNWPQARMIFADGEPTNNYDFITTLNLGSREALKQELKDKLGLAGRTELKDADVLLLKMVNPNAPGLHPPTQEKYAYMHHDDTWFYHRREIKWANESISKICEFLESGSKWPIIDETGVANRCCVDFIWEDKNPQNIEHPELQQALRDQLGLELVLTNMPVEMLVVEKAK